MFTETCGHFAAKLLSFQRQNYWLPIRQVGTFSIKNSVKFEGPILFL